MVKKAFIFDLDGVIVDTAKFHFIAWQRLAASLEIKFTEHENEQLKGVSRVHSLQKILEWGNIKIMPGVHDFLLNLKEQEQPIALGSASKNARPILKKLGILHLFEVIVDGTNVTEAKPDPEVFLHASRQLNFAVQESIVFEDSVAGVQAANAAGMISIGLGEKKILHEADEVFTHFTDMPKDYINTLLSKKK
jgi:beta-phosphoglucomutase